MFLWSRACGLKFAPAKGCGLLFQGVECGRVLELTDFLLDRLADACRVGCYL